MKILYRFKVYGGSGSLALYAAHGLKQLTKKLDKKNVNETNKKNILLYCCKGQE